ncbi:MAG: TonB-dependent receptor [Flavobacteriales bacterium]|nr:TonB-dependent receptor [Flavobacteriales bacterium]
MKKILFVLLLFIPSVFYAQEKFTLSGFVSDKNNGENIIGVNIFCKELKQGVVSNTYGFYSLTLPAGNYEISFSYIGYKTQVHNLNLDKDIQKNIAFDITSFSVGEVEVRAKANIVEKTETSVIEVPIEQIKTIPALLGEVDIIKVIQLLPGVQSSEGTSGFYVRGGGPDQNLILLDGVPVYNASHLGGIFSVFNADAIKSVRLTKGGFPARFGGRLSSVLQIDMKEGNSKEFKGDASIGLISSKFTFEGPIIKDKTSFIISARRTYLDLIVAPFLPSTTDLTLYFYDLNAKINHKISKKDRIYLSAYSGKDKLGVDFSESFVDQITNEQSSLNFELGYGNLTSTLRWNHLFSDKLFSNTTLTYSRYSFNTDFGVNSTYTTNNETEIWDINFGYLSGIEDLGARIDFDFIPNPNHEIKFGTSYTNHNFFPGETTLSINEILPDTSQNFSLDTTLNFSGNTIADELYFYVEDNFKISNRLKANLGIHLGYYNTDRSNSIFKNNISFQPRASVRYLLNDKWSIKGSYAEMTQNIHLLSNSSIGFPSDIWVPATDTVPSQTSKQWAGNISTEFGNGEYELSLEGYYKTMNNLITYKSGYSNLSSTESWENSVETGGIGESYGAELFLQKKKGRTTGWIGYTLSWTNRKFDNINFGEWYPYKFDRRHDFSLVVSHRFNEKWDAGLTWVYGTGNAITFPQAIYLGTPNNGNDFVDVVESYGTRNSTRLDAYHRLDLGFNKTVKKKRITKILSFGAYNFYSRKNPFFAYLTYESGNRVAKQVSLFPIIPSISYRIQF